MPDKMNSDDEADHVSRPSSGRRRARAHDRRKCSRQPGSRQPGSSHRSTARVTLPPPMRSASLPPYTAGSPSPAVARGRRSGRRAATACAALWPPARKFDLQHLAERERETDERSEGADVEQAASPRSAGSDSTCRIVASVSTAVAQVVHESAAPIPAIAISTRYIAHTPYGWRLPTVAITSRPISWMTGTPMLPPPALTAERPALEPLRIKRVDVGHRRREVAAARPGQGRDIRKCHIRQPGMRQHHMVSTRRDQQQQRAEHRPVAAAEFRGAQTCMGSAGIAPTSVGIATS